MPERLQRRRSAGWRKPDGAVAIGRPSRWGNPYRVGDQYQDPSNGQLRIEILTAERAVALYRENVASDPKYATEAREQLAGKDLLCWCPVTDRDGRRVPCHGDVLLDIASGASGGSK